MFKSTTVTYRPVKYKLSEEAIELLKAMNQTDSNLEDQIKFKKNKEFLYSNCNTIKRRFYHYRDANKHPRITICVLYDIKSNKYSRGISLCSFLDQPIKAYGRDNAEDRAIKALRSQKSSCPITRREADILISLSTEFLADILVYEKSSYNIQPTKFELRLFTPPEK